MRVSSQGLCKQCETVLITICEQHLKVINESIKIIDSSNNLDTVMSRIQVVRDKATYLLQYEKKGVPTLTKNPSEIISESHQWEKDAIQRLGSTQKPANLQASFVSSLSDNDLIAGYQFCATIQKRTTLFILEKHGECHPGPPDKLPIYGEEKDGIWLPVTKTWKELGFDVEELSPGTMASDIGQIPEDGGDYLPFLKEFRKIVEQDGSPTEKVKKIKALAKENDKYKKFIDKQAIEIWFGWNLPSIPGVGPKTIEEMATVGIKSWNDLIRADDELLSSVNGVGYKSVKKIREYIKSVQ